MSLLYMRLFCCPCVVMHAKSYLCRACMPQIMCLACARVVPKVLHFFSKFTWDT